MAKAIRTTNLCQKNIVDILHGMTGRLSLWQIWQDFIMMSAYSISNAVDKKHFEEREKSFTGIVAKYSHDDLEKFASMLGNVVIGLDKNPDQDFLGELFMNLDLGNEWKGQFFTPYSVCRCMAGMLMCDDVPGKIAEKGWVSVNDPACGAGALLIAYANECQRRHINYQQSVLFVAQDIDQLAGMMCYIQLSLLGCPGYVVIQDTLRNPVTAADARGLIPVENNNVWYMPMYFTDYWKIRSKISVVDMILKKAG